MSFMNPVDMVEEDAADLQFPKGIYDLLFTLFQTTSKRLLRNQKSKQRIYFASLRMLQI